MTSDPLPLEQLERHVSAVAAARTPAEEFKCLLEAARLVAPRAAFFLVRGNRIHGWGSVGYAPEASRRQKQFSSAADQGWLAELARGDELIVQARPEGLPEYGQVPATEVAGVPIRVRNRSIALLLAERHGDEGPWMPQAMALLATVAQLSLELTLVRRKLEAAAAPDPSGSAEPPTPLPDVPHRPAPETGGLAPVEEATPSAAASPEIEVAQRFARLVATDIRLYNEEAVMLGRRNRDLAERLSESLKRGKETFIDRHGALGDDAVRLLHEAYVEVLAGGDPELLPASLFD
jgi:hypothetical protein